MMNVQVLYQDLHMVIFYKPAGLHVHPHENPIHRVHRDQVLLYKARDLIGQYVYPVHRLDAATSGCIVFALSSAAAKHLNEIWRTSLVEKRYEAVVRGWPMDSGKIELPLELDSTNVPVASETDFLRLAKLEVPIAVGKRHSSSRYALMRAWPRTGRFHQIRRHFARTAHPILGDAAHGDSKHNQFFRNKMGIAGLCLRADRLILHPEWCEKPVEINSPLCPKWETIHHLFAESPLNLVAAKSLAESV